MFKRLLKSSRFGGYLIGLVATTVAVAMEWDESRADELTRLLVIVYGTLTGVLMGGTALEDAFQKLGRAIGGWLDRRKTAGEEGEDPAGPGQVQRDVGPVPESGIPGPSIERPQGFVRGLPKVLLLVLISGAMVLPGAGCLGGNAGVELAASDAIEAAAHQFETMADEYHTTVVAFDDGREEAVTSAFIQRVLNDQANAAEHGAAFTSSLRKIRADREVEWQRHTAAKENSAVLREVAVKMRGLAIDSLSLRDETRRYLTGWIEKARAAREKEGVDTGTR